MNIINAKNLIRLSLFLIPLYLIKFYLFGLPFNIPEVLIMAAFLFWLLDNKNFSWGVFYKENKKIIAGIFIMFLGIVISALINPNQPAEWGIIKSWFIIPLILSFIVLNEVKNKKDAENIFRAVYFSAVTVSFIGLIYFLQGNLTYDFRLKAFYLSPNHLAMFLSPAVFIGNYFIISRTKINAWHSIKECAEIIFLCLSQVAVLLALYLTYSYGAWLALILSLFMVGLITGKNKTGKKMKIAFALAIIFLAISFTQLNNPKFMQSFEWQAASRSSLASRIMIWQSAEKILKDNFLWGIGPGNFQSEYLEYQKYFSPYLEWAVPQPHNLYLAFWLQGGILGLVGFLYLIFHWLKRVIKIIVNKALPKNNFKEIALALLGIMLYILIHGITDTPYWKNDLAIIFWTVFSLGVVSIKWKENKYI